MKCLSFITLMFISSISFSTPRDSIPTPFNSPFAIVFKVYGSLECSGGAPFPSWFLDSIVVNSHDTSHCTFVGDSLYYYNAVYPHSGFGDEVLLVFDSVKGHILECNLSTGYLNNAINNYSTYWFKSLSLRDLRYDSVSIYVDDLSLSMHLIGASYTEEENDQNQNSVYRCSLLSVTSVALSGLFRPIVFSSPALVESDSTRMTELSIRSMEGSLFCFFGASGHYRTLELYTPVGMQVASSEIAPGQTELILPHLQSGLYFVRLDGAVLKIAAP